MKKKIILFSSIGGAVLVAAIILIICLCLPKGDKSYRSIKVFSTTGTVNVIRKNDTLTASKDMKLKNEDRVEVKEASSAVLKLDNDKFVMAKENTTLKLIATGKEKNTKTRILVEDGGVIVEVKEKLKDSESFEIASSNSVMAIRGTQISFNVEVKDNKLTTSFAILDGKTEILLYKDEKLNSTTLSKDFRMSYTTDLSDLKTVDDISNLVDTVEPIVVSDNDLATVFNAIKEELTNEEIDNIVDAINEFERQGKDLVNNTIKFVFTSNPKYKVNPSTLIDVEENYKDLVGLRYLYSKTIDGEYSEFNENSPLDAGEYYCMVKAGNAYKSEPKVFFVVPKAIIIDLPSTLVFDEYFDLVEALNLPTEYSDATIYVKNNPDSDYVVYSKEEMNLDLGTCYLYIDNGSNYTFTEKTFTLKLHEYELGYTYTDSLIGSSRVLLSIKDDEFFNSEKALTVDEETGLFKYYVSVFAGSRRYILDAHNKEVIFPSYDDKYDFSISCNMPMGYDVTNISSEHIVEDYPKRMKVGNMLVVSQEGNVAVIVQIMNNLTSSTGDIYLKYWEKDGDPELVNEPINMDQVGRDEIFQASFVTTSRYTNVQILGAKIGNTDSYQFESEVYELDTENCNMSAPTEFSKMQDLEYYGLITTNSNNTFNFYTDLCHGTECNDDFSYVTIYKGENEATRNFKVGSGRILTLENLNPDTYTFTNIYPINPNYTSGVYYIIGDIATYAAAEAESVIIGYVDYTINQLVDELDNITLTLKIHPSYVQNDVTNDLIVYDSEVTIKGYDTTRDLVTVATFNFNETYVQDGQTIIDIQTPLNNYGEHDRDDYFIVNATVQAKCGTGILLYASLSPYGSGSQPSTFEGKYNVIKDYIEGYTDTVIKGSITSNVTFRIM